MRIGSLFSGAGMLDEGVRAVLGGSVAWHCEVDPSASKVLAHRWPDVPNLGDVTAVDWAQVEPVDVLTGGFPCQDVSHAGARRGLRAGTRSGLWSEFVRAIEVLRPTLVVAENVRGLLSAEADSALEPCPGCVGDGDDGAVLRALGRVLGDLADCGYDARWCGLRAADVGAPHGRFRVFVVAVDSAGVDAGRSFSGGRREAGALAIPRPLHAGCATSSDSLGGGWDGWAHQPQRRPEGRTATAGDRADTAADTANVGHERHWDAWDGWPGPADSGRDAAYADGAGLGRERQEPKHTGPSVAGAGTPADATRVGRDERRPEPARFVRGPDAAVSGATAADAESERRAGRIESPTLLVDDRPEPAHAGQAWGTYEPAIRRWERVLGRPAPAPTELAPRGGQRLSPEFVTWLMGWPAGWVTDVPGVSRNDALRICGNGVVPQQAAAALRWLLAVEDAGRAA